MNKQDLLTEIDKILMNKDGEFLYVRGENKSQSKDLHLLFLKFAREIVPEKEEEEEGMIMPPWYRAGFNFCIDKFTEALDALE